MARAGALEATRSGDCFEQAKADVGALRAIRGTLKGNAQAFQESLMAARPWADPSRRHGGDGLHLLLRYSR